MKQQVDCYDNAMMESLWATLKKELVQHAKFKTRAQARSSIFEWIEVWYQFAWFSQPRTVRGGQESWFV
jgi:putative transposase